MAMASIRSGSTVLLCVVLTANTTDAGRLNCWCQYDDDVKGSNDDLLF